jgi:hypothetical protein
MQHILLATDGSNGADRAAEVAAKLVKATGGRLSILTVGGNLSGDETIARAEGDIGDALEALSHCRSKSQSVLASKPSPLLVARVDVDQFGAAASELDFLVRRTDGAHSGGIAGCDAAMRYRPLPPSAFVTSYSIRDQASVAFRREEDNFCAMGCRDD